MDSELKEAIPQTTRVPYQSLPRTVFLSTAILSSALTFLIGFFIAFVAGHRGVARHAEVVGLAKEMEVVNQKMAVQSARADTLFAFANQLISTSPEARAIAQKLNAQRAQAPVVVQQEPPPAPIPPAPEPIPSPVPPPPAPEPIPSPAPAPEIPPAN